MTQNHRRAASVYHNIRIETCTGGHDRYQLVALLYESLLESLHAALGAMERRDVASNASHVDKVLRILQEGLFAHLDHGRTQRP